MARESAQAAVLRGVAAVRARWPSATRPVPLTEAYCLLSDGEIEIAITIAAGRLGRNLTGVTGVARDGDGRCLIPPPEQIRPYLQEIVEAKLRKGELIARGLDPGNAARGKPAAIPVDRWSLLEPNFDGSAAAYQGRPTTIGVTVELTTTATEKPAPVSDAELRDWFARYKPKNDRAAWAAAKAEFGERVTRDRIRALLRDGGGRRRAGRPLKIMRRENAPEN